MKLIWDMGMLRKGNCVSSWRVKDLEVVGFWFTILGNTRMEAHGILYYLLNTRVSPHPVRSLGFESTPSHGGVSYAHSMIITTYTILVAHNPDSEHTEESGRYWSTPFAEDKLLLWRPSCIWLLELLVIRWNHMYGRGYLMLVPFC